MADASVRASHVSVRGTPSNSMAACRDSEPRTESSVSPREFCRTYKNGICRSTSPMTGAVWPMGAESGAMVTADALPTTRGA
jgi:hypothetical protein